MQYSFYGGQQGKSFKISQIFNTKSELEQDINMRWSSSIGVGEYVIITYGLPSTTEDSSYYINQKVDIDKYGRAYNTTLWEKTYVESGAEGEIYPFDANNFELIFPDDSKYGIAYKLIAAMTGNTPFISLEETDVLPADGKPYVTLDIDNIDYPILTFHLPQSQILKLAETQLLKADQAPNVVLDSSDINSPTLTFYLPRSQVLHLLDTIVLNADQDPIANLDSTDIDNPKLQLSLPQSQVIQLGETVIANADENPVVDWNETDINHPMVTFTLPQSQVLQLGDLVLTDAGTDPTLSLDNTDINRPIIKISLPKGQVLNLGTVTPIDADLDPNVSQDNSDVNAPLLNFELPKSQVIGLSETVILPPQEIPVVALDESDINKPKLTFSLPRAVYMIWGDQLGNKSQINYKIPISNFGDLNLAVGDYYVNENTGYVYIVTDVSDTEIGFEYIGCMRAPLPSIGVTEVDPYDDTGANKTPITVKSQYEDSTEQTGWALQFQMPKIPDPAIEITSIAPDDNPFGTVSPINKNTVNFDFNIPRGSRIFAGDQVKEEDSQVVVTDTINNPDGTVTTITAQNGDMYLNGVTGEIYILRKGKWSKYKGTLKGNKGDSLKIVLSLSFDSITYPNADKDGTVLNSSIEQAFNDKFGRLPNIDEIIAVTWIDKTIPSSEEESSYWYFYSENTEGGKQWDRAVLTGGLSGLFFNEYMSGEGTAEKGYSIQYINGLIGGDLSVGRDKKTLSAKQILEIVEWGDFSTADTDPYPFY